MKLGISVMASKLIYTAYDIDPSCYPVCLYVHRSYRLIGKGSVKYTTHFVARQRPRKNVSVATNKRNSRIIAGRVIFYAVHVLTKESN